MVNVQIVNFRRSAQINYKLLKEGYLFTKHVTYQHPPGLSNTRHNTEEQDVLIEQLGTT